MIIIRKATLEEEPACNALAKLNVYTRYFQNPPLSLKPMRKVAFTHQHVYVAVLDDVIIGFLWSYPMKPKRMKFCSAYYSAVNPKLALGLGSVNRRMLTKALEDAPFGRLEFVCEHANAPTHNYYTRAQAIPNFFGQGAVLEVMSYGVVGKDEHPYTRWSISK